MSKFLSSKQTKKRFFLFMLKLAIICVKHADVQNEIDHNSSLITRGNLRNNLEMSEFAF